MKKLIGNTPMIRIKYKYNNKEKYVYVKLESYNLTGSIKDRMALYIISEEEKSGVLKKGMPIVEATSGNTGISFSALGAKFGYPVHIFMPNWVSNEREKLMKSFGADVTLVSKEEGGFKTCMEKAELLSLKINGYRPNQFSNYLNTECHYMTTGKEIVEKLYNNKIGGFVSGIGSGGTLMGIGKRLKDVYPNILIGAVEPDKMPLLTEGKIKGTHKLDGIGDEFIPKLVDITLIDKVFDINDDDAINMARLLNRELGLGVGISSGANFLGAVLLSNYIDEPIVTIFPDDNKKYLSTDLIGKINSNKDFVSNYVKLIEYDVV